MNVENEWRQKDNYLGEKTLSIHDLFNVMQPTSFKIRFERQINSLRGDNKISDADFEKQHHDLTEKLIFEARIGDASISPDEKDQLADELAIAGVRMSVKAQIDSINKIHEAHISTFQKFSYRLAYLGYEIGQEKKKIDKGEISEKYPNPDSALDEYEENSIIYKNCVSRLPKEDQDSIFSIRRLLRE